MKNFRWILLAGLLVTAPQLAHAQPPAGAPGGPPPGFTGAPPSATTGGNTSGVATDAGGISNGAATTTTTTTTAVAPVAPDSSDVSAEDAAMDSESSSVPNTGGEPLLVVLGGLSVAAMAFGLRNKVGHASA